MVIAFEIKTRQILFYAKYTLNVTMMAICISTESKQENHVITQEWDLQLRGITGQP